MKPIDIKTAKMLLDFSGGDSNLDELGKLQLEGAVALQNMLVNPDVGMGYLADEVGMGKTYIALGVVALMRYFNPGFRVLYICPSRNVQEKWHGREHPNFIKKNVLTRNYKIRTPHGEPGTPSISCSNIEELIHAATTGYYGDIFVRMSSFSIAMRDDEEEIAQQLKILKEHVPHTVLGRQTKNKEAIKRAYARALNYLLPTFDLVIIDEAHNFKHSFDSSARNQVMSRILGFNDDGDGLYRRRVKSALLLSATPFDINPAHLYNQLAMVGKAHLMPGREEWDDKSTLKSSMARFMVRRLNELNIQGERHTRNMYRREWRKGERAEIEFASDEHKLITALMQKQIGDMLNREGGNPAFQLGLLASFESYAQTTHSGPVEFDGEKPLDSEADAQDRHLIAAIRDSYVVDKAFGKSLPHPKMDQVSREAAAQALEYARKQLIFVRRVKSVGELKQKLDDEYDEWVRRHIESTLSGSSDPLRFIENIWKAYSQIRKRRDEDITGGQTVVGSEEDEEHIPPKNDTIFNWFFRGAKPVELEKSLPKEFSSWPQPEALKNSLTARNNANILLFEFNWAAWVIETLYGQTIEQWLDKKILQHVLDEAQPVARDDFLSLYLSLQSSFIGVLNTISTKNAGLEELVNYLSPLIRQGGYLPGSLDEVRQILSTRTFFTRLFESDLAQYFFSTARELAKALKEGKSDLYEDIHKIEVHRQIVAQSFRTGHPGIDLYLARLTLGDADLNESRRQVWLHKLCDMLESQYQFDSFSSARELSLLNDNLELVIKNNLPSVYRRSQGELRVWLNRQLPSSAPVTGATGETNANRSIQARRFRMPGYPLIMVSTDVFQEGEDLHTFCDSVIHYGLSSSPISIEQKTGRVDRVGALAHRRLLHLDEGRDILDDDYIQVRFPFVKQSIEAIQVRTLCQNLNIYLGSLHEVGGDGKTIDEFVDASRELIDRNEIPDQFMEPLESPYIPPVPFQSNTELENKVKMDCVKYNDAVNHIDTLVKSAVDGSAVGKELVKIKIAGSDESLFDICIDSARSCGEILLRVSAHDEVEFIRLGALSCESITQQQAKLYREGLYRTYCVRVKEGYALYRDAEMLVGGDDVTSKEDVSGLFSRFQLSGPDKIVRVDQWVPDFDDSDVAEYLFENFHWSGTFASKRFAKSVDLMFRFDEDRRRKHAIRVQRRGDYCYFEAMVADGDLVRGFSRNKLLRLTWLRNRNIDLVEFLVRPDGCLVGRALHPSDSMGFEEFIFTAYILAVEADRMEYIIKEPDEY